MIKKFLVECTTSWCGMDNTYPVLAESALDIEELAAELARENFYSYDVEEDIAEAEGYNTEDMTDDDWNEMWNNCDEGEYYSYFISEFEGDDEEWESYGKPYEV